VVALVLALLSWVLCPVVLAVAGLVLARSAEREIAASNGWVGGGGLVTATRWVAWINIVLAVVAVVVALLFLIGAAVTSTTTTPGAAG
jgi:hypothetical protein